MNAESKDRAKYQLDWKKSLLDFGLWNTSNSFTMFADNKIHKMLY
jgi:hypothetical protein